MSSKDKNTRKKRDLEVFSARNDVSRSLSSQLHASYMVIIG